MERNVIKNLNYANPTICEARAILRIGNTLEFGFDAERWVVCKDLNMLNALVAKANRNISNTEFAITGDDLLEELIFEKENK